MSTPSRFSAPGSVERIGIRGIGRAKTSSSRRAGLNFPDCASRRNNILWSHGRLERPGIVPHQSGCGENPPQRNEGSKYPVLPSNSCHSAFVLGAVGEKTSIAIERLTTDEQPDLRRLLDVAHPLAVHVRGADVELIVIQYEPNRDFVGLPGLSSIMSQGRGLL